MLRNCPNEDFQQSSFFKTRPQLPSPEDVRAQARAQYLAGSGPDKRKVFGDAGPQWNPPPASFASMGLFVKSGANIMIAEGQSLYAVCHFLKGSVPVPELYGWRTDGGNISREHMYDRAIADRFMAEAGPFQSVEEFHDWFVFLCRRPMADPYSIPMEPFRSELPDDAAISFTHGDLHRSNIMVSKSEPWRVVSIVDWEQSGWMPEYWEDRKGTSLQNGRASGLPNTYQ
ncbi:phosphotransferase enzyme family protein [Coccidioides immitis RS]|uniref:Phosphotransferase enzyme family protein n=1 Tax=Coccidioides immitis (strain RS) TaxID=246410 RepID=A0A0D8JVS5_COCIM|nr:phosphotransferase enzyme family protein [Coccidioides immitis RS]KJF60383.1 phosphotransferase enzyme family protein [Coccidioides immitis RS]